MKIVIFQPKINGSDLLESSLLNEDTFYATFTKDLKRCKSEVIIESPFVTSRRLTLILPTLKRLKAKKVRVVINTRDPHEYEEGYRREEAHRAIAKLQRMGVQVVYTSGHHRKLAILDRKILYEGSLNILSQNSSSEVMRRIESVRLSWQMIGFVGLDNYF